MAAAPFRVVNLDQAARDPCDQFIIDQLPSLSEVKQVILHGTRYNVNHNVIDAFSYASFYYMCGNKCSNHGTNEHSTVTCPSEKCYVCGVFGHWDYICPNVHHTDELLSKVIADHKTQEEQHEKYARELHAQNMLLRQQLREEAEEAETYVEYEASEMSEEGDEYVEYEEGEESDVSEVSEVFSQIGGDGGEGQSEESGQASLTLEERYEAGESLTLEETDQLARQELFDLHAAREAFFDDCDEADRAFNEQREADQREEDAIREKEEAERLEELEAREEEIREQRERHEMQWEEAEWHERELEVRYSELEEQLEEEDEYEARMFIALKPMRLHLECMKELLATVGAKDV